VSRALERNCHLCHGTVPANGAPMSLVTLEDFHGMSLSSRSKPSIPKYEQALMRMDGSRNPPMPPARVAITEADKTLLIDWLGNGALAATGEEASCH
jgi:hypothetical protein